MAEEHGFQSPEGHHLLCANNCGFFGSPATSNLCSKCFRDLQMKEEQNAIAKAALDGDSSGKSSSPRSIHSPTISFPPNPIPDQPALTPICGSSSFSSSSVVPALELPDVALAGLTSAQPQSVKPNRCLTCRKRVGLMGFKCRCGSVFCGSHRYAEQHGCTFDYKATGKEEIARANPVVKAAKLRKI